MPDENGFYTLDDMELTWRQMVEFFDLLPKHGRSGHPDRKWPDGIDSTGKKPIQHNFEDTQLTLTFVLLEKKFPLKL